MAGGGGWKVAARDGGRERKRREVRGCSIGQGEGEEAEARDIGREGRKQERYKLGTSGVKRKTKKE